MITSVRNCLVSLGSHSCARKAKAGKSLVKYYDTVKVLLVVKEAIPILNDEGSLHGHGER